MRLEPNATPCVSNAGKNSFKKKFFPGSGPLLPRNPDFLRKFRLFLQISPLRTFLDILLELLYNRQ